MEVRSAVTFLWRRKHKGEILRYLVITRLPALSDLEDMVDVMNTPPHPADFLNDVLMPATGRSDGEVARLLGVSLHVFYTILTREKPISPSTAAMLGRLFNTGEVFWLNMQADYDRFVARQKVFDAGVVQASLPPRQLSLGHEFPFRHMPMPQLGSFIGTVDHAASDLR